MAEEIRVVSGAPTDEELAALIAVLFALPGPAGIAEPPMSRWSRSARPRQATGPRGRDAWRASALPR